MHVASLELCKELYDLSTWAGTTSAYRVWNDGQTDFEYDATEPNGKYGQYTVLPAYDLGYLLRKLPPHILIYKVIYMDRWCAEDARENSDSGNTVGTFSADTPEDATCSLAIKLFQQGILKKEQP